MPRYLPTLDPRRVVLLAVSLIGAAGPLARQWVSPDSIFRSWTLRSGAVLYRLKNRDGQVVLDFFGPASKVGDSTAAVLPTYPRMTRREGGEPTRSFWRRGLKPDVTYALTLDGAPLRRATDAEPASAGLTIPPDAEWRAAMIELTPAP